jgi:hypothetical protein
MRVTKNDSRDTTAGLCDTAYGISQIAGTQHLDSADVNYRKDSRLHYRLEAISGQSIYFQLLNQGSSRAERVTQLITTAEHV